MILPAENPDLAAAIAAVTVTFNALTKARAKFNRCTRDDSREAARLEMVKAEGAYQIASDKRDALVEIDRARRTQNGDPLGAHWSRSHAGPALPAAEIAKAKGVKAKGKAKPAERSALDRPWARIKFTLDTAEAAYRLARWIQFGKELGIVPGTIEIVYGDKTVLVGHFAAEEIEKP